MPWKTFAAGEEALAADINTHLMKQAVATFPTAAARAAAITAPVKGQVTARDDKPNAAEMWDGATWVSLSPIDYLFGKAVGTLINAGANASYSLVLPAAPMGGAILLDLYAKIDTGAGTFSQNITVTVDPAAGTPVPSVTYAGYGTLTTAVSSLQTRTLGAWPTVTRGQVVTASIKVTNAGGSGQVNWARVDGIVRFMPAVSAF